MDPLNRIERKFTFQLVSASISGSLLSSLVQLLSYARTNLFVYRLWPAEETDLTLPSTLSFHIVFSNHALPKYFIDQFIKPVDDHDRHRTNCFIQGKAWFAGMYIISPTFSKKIQIVSTQQNCLSKMILKSTQNLHQSTNKQNVIVLKYSCKDILQKTGKDVSLPVNAYVNLYYR